MPVEDPRGHEQARRHYAGVITDDELDREYIVPSVFNRSVAEAVAQAVAEAAVASGVARRAAGETTDVRR